MLLAGDVGGTKTLVGLYTRDATRPAPVEVREFPTLEYDGLEAIVSTFFESRQAPTPAVEAACFGVAGPIVGRAASLVNVPWQVDAAALECAFGIQRVILVNDLAAMAYAVPVLEADELAVLQEGRRLATGNAAVIAAGTGLGQALLHNVNGRFVPSPTEAGHADFAARTPREIELLQELTRIYGRVDSERVISGPGLANLFRFTHAAREPQALLSRAADASSDGDSCPGVGRDPDPAMLPQLVTASALAGRCPFCREALDLFIGAYGAEAGNLALRTVATAGVYLGGGIAPKILPAFRTGRFLDAFCAKAPMADLLATIPIAVILNTNAALLGAAVAANQLG